MARADSQPDGVENSHPPASLLSRLSRGASHPHRTASHRSARSTRVCALRFAVACTDVLNFAVLSRCRTAVCTLWSSHTAVVAI